MKNFSSCFRGLLDMIRPVRRKVWVIVLTGIVLVAVSLLFVWISKHVVDIATSKAEGSLDRAVILMAGVMLLQLALRVFSNYWKGLVEVDTRNRLTAGYFGKVMRSAWNGQDRFHSGDTVNRLEEDIRVCVDFIVSSLPDFLVTVVQLVAASVFLFILAPSLTWVLLIIMPVAVLGSRLFFRKMRSITGEIRALDSRIQGYMQENIQHRILVRTLKCTRWVLGHLTGLQNDVRGKTVSRLSYSAVSRAFMGLGFAAGYATVFFWSVYGLRNGTVTYGLMTAFLQLAGQVQRPVADMARQIPAFIRALSSTERLMELSELPEAGNGEDILLPGAPGIRVTGLGFSYPDVPEPVLKDLDFDFKPGTMTVIEGPTGVGKSTLLKLMLSLLKPVSGKVELYDPPTPVSEETLCNFMYVPQGNSLMSGTIRDNLRLAMPDADEERMLEVLHLAAADFVKELPDGLDTVCSEVGGGLSEGQAQRIAIARALLRPGGILLLDEATSALDPETEKVMLERISGAFRRTKTIICITHRPAASVYADSVLTLGLPVE